MKRSEWPDRQQPSDQTLHLKKLAQGAINDLTNIFNLSISTGPEKWNKAIQKPYKHDNIGAQRPRRWKNSSTAPISADIDADVSRRKPPHRPVLVMLDDCIPQCRPSTTARLCLQHQHVGNNPSLVLQLYAEQTNLNSFSATSI